MIVRELVTRLGFALDAGALARAEKGYARLRRESAGVEASADRREVSAARAARADAARARDERGRFLKRERLEKNGMRAAAARARDAKGRYLKQPGKEGGGLLDHFEKAGDALEDLMGDLRNMMKLAAGGFVVHGAIQLVEMASDVRETANLLQVTFGAEGKALIDDWARNTGEAMGRSQHQLREDVGNFGAFLKNYVADQGELIAMSQALSQRVIDLASFRNLDEKTAMEKIRAGLAGETEPLRAIGVDVSVSAMEEYAKSIGQVYSESMPAAQKMQLRYNLIMARTADASGDAVNTADEYANSVRGMQAQLRDLGTAVGETLRPFFGWIVRATRDATIWFLKWQKGTGFVQAAIISLTAYLGYLGIAMSATYLKALPAFLTIAGSILIAAVALDELNAMFSGGRSLIGDYLDQTFGLGTTDTVVRSLSEGVESLKDGWQATLFALQDLLKWDGWTKLYNFIDDIIFPIREFLNTKPTGFAAMAMEFALGKEGWKEAQAEWDNPVRQQEWEKTKRARELRKQGVGWDAADLQAQWEIDGRREGVEGVGVLMAPEEPKEAMKFGQANVQSIRAEREASELERENRARQRQGLPLKSRLDEEFVMGPDGQLRPFVGADGLAGDDPLLASSQQFAVEQQRQRNAGLELARLPTDMATVRTSSATSTVNNVNVEAPVVNISSATDAKVKDAGRQMAAGFAAQRRQLAAAMTQTADGGTG